jgi:hypothetical protein
MVNFLRLASDHRITEKDVVDEGIVLYNDNPFKPTFEGHMLLGLNPQQAQMVVDAVEYIDQNKKGLDYFVVQGVSGSGKTYSVRCAIAHIPVSRVVIAAPSHFAKNVLRAVLGDQYTVLTIASLLGMRVVYDDEGNEVLVKNWAMKRVPIKRFDVVIIDEVSMVGDDTASMLISETQNKKLLVLGDYAQLPPVGQAHDALFFRNICAELDISMRFTGPIGLISNAIRAEIDKVRDGYPPTLNIINQFTDRNSDINNKGSGYIFINSNRTLLNTAIKRFKMNKGNDYARVIAYRNKTVNMINKAVRKGLFGDNPKQFEEGELLINNKGYSVSVGGHTSRLISNGENFIVESAEKIIGPYDLPCVALKFKNRSFEDPIITLATESIPIYDRILKRLTKIASADKQYWTEVKAFKEAFAYFSYFYCASSHKIQGSSIKYVFVLEDDILSVKPTTIKEKLQSLYVAVSRASFRVYIFNKKFKVYNESLKKEFLIMEPDE